MRLTPIILAPLMIMAATLPTGCSGRRNDAVPKPHTYHRIQTPDSTYRLSSHGNLDILLNSAATFTDSVQGNGRWVDITYPHFNNVRIFLTINEVDAEEMPSLITNREERIVLDAGNSAIEITELTSAGRWGCRLFVTRNSISTPIHLMGVSPDSTQMVYGVAYTQFGDGVAPDSIAPIVRTLERDMLVTLKNLER